MAQDSFGTKNQPQYSSSGVPADAADLSQIANYAANVGNRKAGTSSARTSLTGADLWNGLEYSETDTGCVYNYFNGAWVLVDVIGIVRRRAGQMTASAAASGTTLGTLSLPALPVATRVIIDLSGTVGFGSAANFSVTFAASAGTLTAPGPTAVPVAAAVWGSYSRKGWVDLPANTALTVTFTGYSSSGTAYWDVGAELNALLAGQY